MKLGTFRTPDGNRIGLVGASGIVDLSARTGEQSLRRYLAQGMPDASRYSRAGADFGMEELDWLPPIPDPQHIVAVGLNTHSHLEEIAKLRKHPPESPPAHPRLFMRVPESHVGHRQDIWVPRISSTLDYEGEIALVIGRGGRYIAKEQAQSHIAGICCYNDGSVREYQRHSNQVTAGKNFERSGAFGPWLATTDELPPLEALELQTRVNGELRQTLKMDDLLFSFADLISYISNIFTLQPGDVIVTGSPAGVGAVDGNYLRPGDTVEISISGLGTLRNRVIDEPMESEPLKLGITPGARPRATP